MLLDDIYKMKEENQLLKAANSILSKRANEATSELFRLKVINLFTCGCYIILPLPEIVNLIHRVSSDSSSSAQALMSMQYSICMSPR